MRDLELVGRWNEMWNGIGAKGDATRYLDEVIARYSQPHRKYHTVKHLSGGFGLIWQLRDAHPDFDWYRIAFAFAGHDIFCDPHLYTPDLGSLCERVSADWTKCIAREVGLSESFCDDMDRLVMATAHRKLSDRKDEQMIADIDLAILGLSSFSYNSYCLQIREEFGFLSDEVFFKGRRNVLEKLLHRGMIYQTKIFQDLYEDGAQSNILIELFQIAS